MSLEDILGRYIITAAEHGAKPNYSQLEAYESYAKHWGAEIVIIPINGQHRDVPLDDVFSNYTVATKMRLNNNLRIQDFSTRAQQINPLTGLRRFGKSMIVGSPKQHLEYVANSPKRSPNAIMSTGAVTLPNYKDNAIGLKAYEDHVQGAILVETEDDTLFHFRQAVNAKDGSFIDLGIKYTADSKPAFVGSDTVVLGDLHDHQKDWDAYQTAHRLIDEVKPRFVVGHDVMDSYSISHHDEHKSLTRAKKAKEIDLETELRNLGQTVTEIAGKVEKFYIVKSNHDEHLSRYLEEGRYVHDPANLGISLKLAQAMYDGKDPVREGIKLAYGSVPKNVVFLQRDDELKRHGVELSFHGDKGPRGTRGSPISLEYSLRNAAIGHGHTPFIRKGLMSVGAMVLNPLYAQGSPGNNLSAHAIINHNGTKQLVNDVNGRYTA